MARQIIKQPNGLYAEWSSVVDDFVLLDATREEIIQAAITEYTKFITDQVNGICDSFDKGELPPSYHKPFVLAWEDALELRKKVHGDSVVPIQIGITDYQRRKWLVANGYTPKQTTENKHLQPAASLTDTEFVDWCIKNKFVPAYWIPFDPLKHCKPSNNGMVFDKPGDRERIDQIIGMNAAANTGCN